MNIDFFLPEEVIKLSDVNSKQKTMYIGFKMKDEIKKEIFEICKSLNVQVKIIQVAKDPFNIDIVDLV